MLGPWELFGAVLLAAGLVPQSVSAPLIRETHRDAGSVQVTPAAMLLLGRLKVQPEAKVHHQQACTN